MNQPRFEDYVQPTQQNTPISSLPLPLATVTASTDNLNVDFDFQDFLDWANNDTDAVRKPMVSAPAAEPSAKKRKEPESDGTLWACPACLRELGEEGMVPMTSTKCSAGHLLCYECVQRLIVHKTPAGRTYKKCPICNLDAGKYLFVPGLVNANDAKAQALLKIAGVEPKKRKQAKKVTRAALPLQSDGDVVARRVNHIISRVCAETEAGCLKKFPTGVTLWDEEVPEWDANYVRLHGSAPGFVRMSALRLAEELRTMARSLQPTLDSIYEHSPYRVTMLDKQIAAPDGDYTHVRPRFAYLVFLLEKRPQAVIDLTEN